jgi:hypothetical protein
MAGLPMQPLESSTHLNLSEWSRGGATTPPAMPTLNLPMPGFLKRKTGIISMTISFVWHTHRLKFPVRKNSGKNSARQEKASASVRCSSARK